MSSSMVVAPKAFALKLKIHCKDCERKLKRKLLKIEGVDSVNIDAKLDNVIISGPVDPAAVLDMLENVGRKVELLWAQGSPRRNEKKLQIIQPSKRNDPLNDPDIMAQLEQLYTVPGLKTLEVTKTVKMTFHGEKNDPNGKIVEIPNKVNTPHQGFPKGSHGHEAHDHGHGGGLCAASSSCCGGHGAISTNAHSYHGCCHGHWPAQAPEVWGTPSPWPPPSNDSFIPSAPPLPSDYYYDAPPPPPPPPPPLPYTFSTILSDENPNSCIII